MAPHDEGFKSNEALETVFLRKIKVAVPQKMRERWGQEEEWSEKRRQMMLFQDHGGLIMMVSLCSLLTCSGSLFFLSIFSPLVPLPGSIGHAGYKLRDKLLIYDLLHWFSKKESDGCSRARRFARAQGPTHIPDRTQECSRKTHAHTQKINHRQKEKKRR